VVDLRALCQAPQPRSCQASRVHSPPSTRRLHGGTCGCMQLALHAQWPTAARRLVGQAVLRLSCSAPDVAPRAQAALASLGSFVVGAGIPLVAAIFSNDQYIRLACVLVRPRAGAGAAVQTHRHPPARLRSPVLSGAAVCEMDGVRHCVCCWSVCTACVSEVWSGACCVSLLDACRRIARVHRWCVGAPRAWLQHHTPAKVPTL